MKKLQQNCLIYQTLTFNRLSLNLNLTIVSKLNIVYLLSLSYIFIFCAFNQRVVW